MKKLRIAAGGHKSKSKVKNQNAIRLCIKLRRTRIVESLRSVFARGFAATSGNWFYRTAGGF